VPVKLAADDMIVALRAALEVANGPGSRILGVIPRCLAWLGLGAGKRFHGNDFACRAKIDFVTPQVVVIRVNWKIRASPRGFDTFSPTGSYAFRRKS